MSLLDLCVHYGMPSIPPSARGRRVGNSCSPVTAETREMLDIKKTDLFLHGCVYIYSVCVRARVCETERGLLFHVHENRHFQV